MSTADDDRNSVYFHSGWKAALEEVRLLIRAGHGTDDLMNFAESQLKR